MRFSLIVHNPDGSTLSFPLDAAAPVKIGRAADNDIVLVDPDRSVSRWHAIVGMDSDGAVSVTDLNSSNGTHVNGARIHREHRLQPNDNVRLGQFRLVLTGEEPEEDAFAIQAGSVELGDLQETATLFPLSMPEAEITPELRNLELLYEVGMTLVKSRSTDEVEQAAIGLLFRIPDVDRATVMSWDEERGAFGSFDLKMRDSGQTPEVTRANDPSGVVLSPSILDRIRRDNRPLLIRGANTAPEYLADTKVLRVPAEFLRLSREDPAALSGWRPDPDRSSPSTGGIRSRTSDIRAAFCAPLSFQGRFLGILYADNLREPEAFSEAGFRIFSSIAAQTGLALANAIANERLLERELERQALKLYLPPQVADRIVASGGVSQLQGVLQSVAVLYADIRGFTALSEQMEARALVRMLNEFFSAMSAVIFECNGTLDKFIGDCIMALFGAPVESGRAPREALEAAIGMQRAMERLNAERARRGEAPFEIGIGLHCGPAVVGNIGSADRVQYTAIGDTVNVASRLVDRAAASQIIVSEDVRAAVAEYGGFEQLGEAELKGRTGRKNLYIARWTEVPLE